MKHSDTQSPVQQGAFTKTMTRRSLLPAVALSPAIGLAGSQAWSFGIRTPPKPTDACIDEVSYDYEEFLYRTPYKFGGRSVDRVTLLNVHCSVRTRDGSVAVGLGSMPLGNVWSFPSKVMSYDTTLSAMKALAGRHRSTYNANSESFTFLPSWAERSAAKTTRWLSNALSKSVNGIDSPFLRLSAKA